MVKKFASIQPAADPARWGDREARQELGAAVGAEDVDESLTNALIELVDSTDLGGAEFYDRLSTVEAEYGDSAYSQLIFLLCHLRFEPAEAKSHWLSIVEHRAGLERSWGSAIDARVALASYFLHVSRQLESPTIIEMRLLEETRAYAYRDELTGLRNYRFFELYLFHELLRSDQYSSPLALIMLDVDDFKLYNDHFGHSVGNKALAEVGRIISESCRRVDVPARYGGEEFAIIRPATPKVGALMVADRTREAIEEELGRGDPERRLTVSAGIAIYPADASSSEELVQRADEALYGAKSKGKNRVELFGENRRSYRRVKARLSGQLIAASSEPHVFTTVDISEGGWRFLTDVELATDSLVDLRVTVPGHDREFNLGGRVVKCELAESGEHDSAIRVVDLSTRDRQTLARYLLELGIS